MPGLSRYTSLALFVVVVLGVGTLIGFSVLPGDWYAGLAKPPFNPPNWVFGPVWSLLYILIAIAGWRTWRDGSAATMKVWAVQMVLNFLWSPVFFGAQQPGLAMIVIVLLLVAVLLFIARAWPADRISASLFVPYAAWVAFACLLNASIFWLNPD